MCPECYHTLKAIPIPPGGKIRFGRYDWFVLDKQDDRALILTEKVIEKRNYHGQESEISWETCDLRKYLNGEFYNSFCETDRTRIIEVVNENHDNPWYGTSGGGITADKIFLLSLEEVVKYFGDSGQLKNKTKNPGWGWTKEEYLPWSDDQFRLKRCAVDDAGKVCWWRLRSPGAKSYNAAAIFGNAGDGFDACGAISFSGGEYLSEDGYFIYNFHCLTETETDTTMNGVRPALWLRVR